MNDIFIIGYPKSGNTWLSRLMGDVLNCPVRSGLGNLALADEGFDRRGKYIIRQRHTRQPVDGKIIVITRDPRDVFVSIMYYWQHKTLEEAFYRIGTEPGDDWGISIFYDLWFNQYKRHVDVYTTYEALLKDTNKELARILQALNVDFNKGRIDGTVRRQSFNKRRKSIKDGASDALPYGKEIQLQNMRKGIAGDWKNHFRRKHGKIVHQHLWEWIYRLGYEKDKSWWESLPE